MPIDVTDKYIHYRILSPKKCSPTLTRYASEGRGVQALHAKGIRMKVCCPKGKAKGGKCTVGMVKQALVFDRKKWTKSRAKRYVRDFKK
jgi:hypothetical protein